MNGSYALVLILSTCCTQVNFQGGKLSVEEVCMTERLFLYPAMDGTDSVVVWDMDSQQAVGRLHVGDAEAIYTTTAKGNFAISIPESGGWIPVCCGGGPLVESAERPVLWGSCGRNVCHVPRRKVGANYWASLSGMLAADDDGSQLPWGIQGNPWGWI